LGSREVTLFYNAEDRGEIYTQGRRREESSSTDAGQKKQLVRKKKKAGKGKRRRLHTLSRKRKVLFPRLVR